ncbi:glutamyl-tRNA reductase [Helicobacter muridarum]|uniref:Glutamyl-tRNA reductase n=1 Tax=Helicobacter muridarum TaxID=216 RepID=A0A099TZG9_9HELI|nr:glutamyl-tRNA reductase [Helicobacter muridarum]TLD99840.1 glutamyl-tRNA reductase [Helicobacter muridarum]STQ86951.1 glutamyl-tRNA reductase [Helicobacter muridarum]
MYALVSFSHQNTDMSLREKLHFSDKESKAFLPILLNINGIVEIILLSTCNRCEIYLFLDSAKFIDSKPESVFDNIIEAISNKKFIQKETLKDKALILQGKDAIYHSFCVASSLLSLALGETQISGQLKNAYKVSYDNGFCAKHLTRLMHFAFRCAAEVRNKTDISKNPISIASVAVGYGLDFLNSVDNINSIVISKNLELMNDLEIDSNIRQVEYKDEEYKPRILVIGIGEMGVLCLKYLTRYPLDITICNRTLANAQQILLDLGLQKSVKILDFSSLKPCINDYDVVFSAVGGGILLTKDSLYRKDSKRLFIDLSIPRNIAFDTHDIEKYKLGEIEVIGVDNLKSKADEFINSRKQSAKEAHEIVARVTIEFLHWLSTLEIDPIIKGMRARAKQASIKEINRAIKKGFIPEALRDNAMKLLHSAFNEFLHSPTMKLKAMAEHESYDTVLESIGNVFGDGEQVLLNQYKCEK